MKDNYKLSFKENMEIVGEAIVEVGKQRLIENAIATVAAAAAFGVATLIVYLKEA